MSDEPDILSTQRKPIIMQLVISSIKHVETNYDHLRDKQKITSKINNGSLNQHIISKRLS